MRCLVTGASGHVGSFLVRRLLAEGAVVSALVRPTSDLWRLTDVLPQINLIRADIDSIHSVAGAMQEATPEYVFHLAWQGVIGGFRNDREQITKNVPGTLALLDMVQNAGCRCWVGVGSQAEYGPVDGVLEETLSVQPQTAYGVAKHAARILTEKMCQISGETRFLWFRLLATYGPKDDLKHLIPSVVERLLAGERPALTPGEQQWDYLYIDDAVEAMVQAALFTKAEGLFNLGSGQAHTVRGIVETVRNIIDPRLPLGFGEVAYRSDQVMHLEANIRKLQEATGWSPTTDLTQGLRRTVDWHREQRIRQV